jgi:Fe-S cluster assembly protein SufD
MSAQIIPSKTAAEIGLAETFSAAKARLPGTADIAKLREDNFGAFVEAGLPHRRIEAWHYTDLRTLMREALPIAPAATPAAIEALGKAMAEANLPGQKLVLVDGVFVPELSDHLPVGVTVKSLAAVLGEGRADLIEDLSAGGLGTQDAIVALNAALMLDGVVIEVAPGTVIAEPIQLISASVSATPAAQFSRSLIVIGAGASVRLAESNFGALGRAGQSFNALIAKVGDEAFFGHTAMVSGSLSGSVALDSFMVRLGAKSKFDSFALVDGAGLTVEHLAPGCVSRELFKYILDEEAIGVFQGKIHVASPAQKTDGKMLCKALLLSDGVVMNNKPELEIFADDVACGHGATCGGLSQDQLFYLEARGLPHADAEALLLEAFAGELADEIGHEGLTEVFRGEIRNWLSARGKA